MNVLTSSVENTFIPIDAGEPANSADIAFVANVTDLASKLWAEKDQYDEHERVLCAFIHVLMPKISKSELFDQVPNLSRQMGLSDVFHALANLGFVSHAIKVQVGQIEPRLTPCLFVPAWPVSSKRRQPILILKISSNETGQEVKYYDSLTNDVQSVDGSHPLFRRAGTAYFLRKENSENQATSTFQRQATKYSWFRAMLTRFHKEFVCTVLLSLFINLLTLATPLFIMLVYDRVISVKASEPLPMLVVGALVGISFEWMLRTYRGQVISWTAARIDWLVGTHIVEKLFSLPPVYAEKATVSAQIARIKAFEAVREFFAGSTFYSVIELPFVIVAVVAIGFVAGPLVIVPLVMIVPFLILYKVMQKRMAVAMRVAAKIGSMRQKFLISSLGLIEQIDASGLTDVWQKKHRSLTGREQVSRFQLSWLSNIAESFAQALLSISAIMTLTFGVFLVWDGTISAGGLVATMILVWRILSPLYSLCTSISRFEQIRNSVRQVNQLMEIEGETGVQAGARLKAVKGKIDFDNVRVQYNVDSPAILTSLTFSATPGNFVLITGESGSGKSSILKLTQGLYAAQAGSVRIDGFDIRQLDVRHLRRQVAYVPQRADFFNGSILENMRFAKPDATEKEIWQMLGDFFIATEVRAMPDGIHTQISQIKSSQTKFALNLARAFIKNSNLILIDKMPDALLAGETGSAIRRMIMRQNGKRTIVMVSSRADFLGIADLAVVLRRNKKPLVGTPDELEAHIHLHANAAAN